MFGVGSSYPSSGGLPLLTVKSICLASNPVTFGSEGHGPSQTPRVGLSQPRGGAAPSTPAPLRAASCFLPGDSCTSQSSSSLCPAGHAAWRAAGLACRGQGDVFRSCKVITLLEKSIRLLSAKTVAAVEAGDRSASGSASSWLSISGWLVKRKVTLHHVLLIWGCISNGKS